MIRTPDPITVAHLDRFDEVIDVRTPSEFQEDHIPGALNLPVLSDEERARVGTLYKQVSPFEAKKVGAALVSRNIAAHLEHELRGRPRGWRPLVYCWRGGKRSGALAHILEQVGWKAGRLEGGYKAYRRQVISDLETIPPTLCWRVVCGATGSGKTRLLAALARAGAQVLDLEHLASHRGSVLGDLPRVPQPSQKMFESLLWERLRKFDPRRPVHVEAESKKIGELRVPEALILAMWNSRCVRLDLPLEARIELLREEYRHFLEQPDQLCAQLDCLTALHGADTIARWKALARTGNWNDFVAQLLTCHYDPAYRRSTGGHYPLLKESPVLSPRNGTDAEMDKAALRILESPV